jgi:hypothetical protein
VRTVKTKTEIIVMKIANLGIPIALVIATVILGLLPSNNTTDVIFPVIAMASWLCVLYIMVKLPTFSKDGILKTLVIASIFALLSGLTLWRMMYSLRIYTVPIMVIAGLLFIISTGLYLYVRVSNKKQSRS